MKSTVQPTPFLAAIARKGASPDRVAERVAGEPGLLPEILAGLGADEPRVKYGCSKVLRLVSQKHPAVLYPRFDFFAGLLDADNNFLKWDAARVVANLASADAEGKLEPLLNRYLGPIGGPVMITAANLIVNAATIALARPELAGRLARAVLKVERAEYQTAECRNVAIGHAIESFGRFFHLLEAQEKAAVVKFVRRQLANRRNAVRKKAAAFLKRHATSPAGKSQPLPPNAFIGQTRPPSDAEVSAALGNAKPFWDQLVAELASEHGLKTEWKFYSIKMGWSFRLKRKERNIVHFGPFQGGFQVVLIFGDKTMAAVRETKWPPRVRKILNEALRYPEGTGVRLEIKNTNDIEVVKQLAALKLAN
jgi:hypothetical protein